MSRMWRILLGMGWYRKKWKKSVKVSHLCNKDIMDEGSLSAQRTPEECLKWCLILNRKKACTMSSLLIRQAAKIAHCIGKKKEVKQHDTTQKSHTRFQKSTGDGRVV